jgi:uncharacterized protein YbcV (DUF1398 family)
MFTIDQIKDAHSKVKSGADFPSYIQDLIVLGVISYDTYVNDGHTDYFGLNDFTTSAPAKYKRVDIAETGAKSQFISALKAHQNGLTDYPTFCKDCAKSGVYKWTVNLTKMTCTYFDIDGNELLVEGIPS